MGVWVDEWVWNVHGETGVMTMQMEEHLAGYKGHDPRADYDPIVNQFRESSGIQMFILMNNYIIN